MSSSRGGDCDPPRRTRYRTPILTKLAIIVPGLLVAASIPQAGAVSPGVLRGARSIGAEFIDTGGCWKEKSLTPSWSRSTEVGRMSSSDRAMTCPKSIGGATDYSFSESQTSLEVYGPVSVPVGVGGVNVSWSLNLSASISHSQPSSAKCPFVKTSTSTFYSAWVNGTSGNSVPTWFNVSIIQAECIILSEVYLFGGAYVANLSGGPTIYPSNTWMDPTIYNYTSTYGQTYWWNFSNPAASPNVYSFTPTYSGSSGTPTQNMSGTFTPEWFMNASAYSTAFWAHSHYEMYSYIGEYAFAEVLSFPGSSAAATVNTATGSHHIQLLPISVW